MTFLPLFRRSPKILPVSEITLTMPDIRHLVFLLLLLPLQVVQGDENRLSSPHFSHTSGFYREAFSLLLSTDVPGATIYYTLDGSVPDPDNPEGSTYQYKHTWSERPGDPSGTMLTGRLLTHVYNDPVRIDERLIETERLSSISSTYYYPAFYLPSSPPARGVVVRAIAAKPGYISSPVATHTYLVMDRDRYTLPVIAISTGADNLFDYHTGIYTPGAVFDKWRRENPGSRADGGSNANYHQRGEEWEKPAHFTMWETSGNYPRMQQDIGIRTHGGWSRAAPMKSLRLYARSEYGKSTFEYPVFPEQDYNEYKRLILRNSGNDNPYTMFRDALIQRVCRELNFDTQAYRPVILLINGEYWGIHNIRERYDRHYIKRVYGIEGNELDLLTGRNRVKEGHSTHYIETLAYIETNGLQEDIHYDHIRTRIDTRNFIDYQVANIWSANTDWPANNIDYFRKQTATYEPDAPCGHDGRWRWMAFDMDFGLGIWWKSPEENMMEFSTSTDGPQWPNPPWATFLFRKLLENESFRIEFINRFADLLNSSFLPGRVNHLIDEYQQGIEPGFREHIDRWKHPASMMEWQTQIGLMRNFANRRNDHQWDHLSEFFNIETVSVIVDVCDPLHGHIRVNTIDIRPGTPGIEGTYPWKGTYFKTIPVRIEAVAGEGYRFSHWEGAGDNDSPVISGDAADMGIVKAVFVAAERKDLIHYWHFNDLPAGDSLLQVPSDFSAGENGRITYPGTGTGYMDRVSDGSELGSKKGMLEGQGLRLRNPSSTREMVFYLPSAGYENLVLSFAAKRTPNGATGQFLLASGDKGVTWVEIAGYIVAEEWQLRSFDLSGQATLNDNPDLLVKIIFTGDNTEGSSGNNRFDNVSLEGDPLFKRMTYYSREDGFLDRPESWGSETDGSGTPPADFSSPGTTYVVRNADAATISGDWTVSGISSRVVAGDGTNPLVLTLPAEYVFSGRMDVSDNATVFLNTGDIPVFGFLSPSSTVVFSQNGHAAVPAQQYGNLNLRNGIMALQGNITVRGSFIAEEVRLSPEYPTEMTLKGDLHFHGNVEISDPENWNIQADGSLDQLFSSPVGNRLDAWNLYFEKSSGSLLLSMDVHAGNNLRLNFTGSSLFSDGGHTLQLNDDLQIRGNPENYNLAGTIILTAGSGTNELEITDVPVSNLVIDVDGDARVDFSGSGDRIIMNDLVLKSSSSRPVLAGGTRLHVRGDLLVDMAGPENIRQDNSYLVFDGERHQRIVNLGFGGPGLFSNMVVNNPAGLTIAEGPVTIDRLLHLETGTVTTGAGNILKLGPGGKATQSNPSSHVSGPLGVYSSGREPFTVLFPLGKNNMPGRMILDAEHEDDGMQLYIAEFFDDDPALLQDFGEIFESAGNTGYYSIQADREESISSLTVALTYQGKMSQNLTIAMLRKGIWLNMGSEYIAEKGMYRTVNEISRPGIFALAGIKIPPVFEGRIRVYPNPVPLNGTVYLPGKMDVTVVDMKGITLFSETNTDRINLQGFAPGVYLIRNQLREKSRILILSR